LTYRGTILSSLEAVDSGLAWRHWTLGDAIDAVHLVGSELPHTMPMESGSIGGQVIRY
jgi:hypothetical protein